MRNDNLSPERISENEFYRKNGEFFLNGLPPSTSVCRVFKAEYLKSLIQLKKNTLVHISMWEDPFEGFLLKQPVHSNGQIIDISTFYKDFYGQSWSLNENESDATWRIYSNEKDGVLVRTTLGKLWGSFYNPKYTWSITSCSVGRVQYWDESQIVSQFNGVSFGDMLDSQLQQLKETLLIKRTEFTHENELRLIYHDTGKLGDGRLVSYDIDPPNFITELIADPRMDQNLFNELSSVISQNSMSIRKSNLYTLRNLNLHY